MTDWTNIRLNLRSHWKTGLIGGFGLVGACVFAFSVAHAAVLENPSPNSFSSGIGVISGWKCDAGELTVRFDGGEPIPLAYLNERADTASVCGDTDNGFVSIMNWGNLGDGEHTAIVYDDGEEFDRSVFTVRRFQEAFVTNASLTVSAQDFPNQGETAVFAWSQPTQHLELADAFGTPTGTDPPNCAGWVTGEGDEAFQTAAWVAGCLEAGADPNARDEDGNTPLYRFGDNHGDVGRVASLLLAAGADPNVRNNQGRTPLHDVLSEHDSHFFEVVIALLEAGADPNARDQYGDTALHLVHHGYPINYPEDMERAFIRAGADPNLLDEKGIPYRCKTFECLAKKTYRRNR